MCRDYSFVTIKWSYFEEIVESIFERYSKIKLNTSNRKETNVKLNKNIKLKFQLTIRLTGLQIVNLSEALVHL